MRRLLSLLVRLVSRRRVRRPAKPAPRSDDTPPPVRVIVYPRRVSREAVCPGCGEVTTPAVAHACWGKWWGME